MRGWNPWKLTAISIALVVTTAVVTGLVVAHWSGSQATRSVSVKEAAAPPPPAPPRAPSRQPLAPAPPSHAAKIPQQIAATPQPAVSPQPVTTVPTQEAIDACNRFAADQVGQKDKTTEVAKDAVIGAVAGAAIGAAGGAIAGGGKGAGKGAAIGGVLGAGGGTLYGLSQNKKRDQQYREAYAGCMRSRGYSG